MSNAIYLFLDEAGDLTFSDKGTNYFILSSLAIERPFPGYIDLVDLRYDLVEYGFEVEAFHASEDNQAVRDRVFGVIKSNIKDYRIDSLIVEKRKTQLPLKEITKFYPQMFGYLLRYVVEQLDLTTYSQVIVVTDTIPLKIKRRAIEGETKRILKECMPEDSNYRIMHHSSKSNINLQIIDYCCWAVFRKWERNDSRSYQLIKDGLKSEFDLFRTGKKYYY